MARKNTTETPTNPATRQMDLLRGMGAICDYLRVSPATALKWIRELDLPCRKTRENGGGQWISSKSALDEWSRAVVSSAKIHQSHAKTP